MKKFSLLVMMILSSEFAMAGQLNCWLTTFKQAKFPFMTAEIVSDSELANVKFLYKKHMAENGNILEDHPEVVEGALIETNHSPYKNNVRYFVKGAGDLILPADLSNESLIATNLKGIGYYKGENGVLISNFDGSGDGAGNHVSYRLNCSSDL